MNACCSSNAAAANSRAGTSPAPAQAQACCQSAKHYRPHADVVEAENEFRIAVDVPGATSESVELDLNNGVLTITANVPARERQGAAWLRREYGVGAYRRTFQLGDGIDTEGIAAELAHGVLTVTLPKTAARRSRKIEVRNN